MTLRPGFGAVLAAARTGAEWAWTALYRELAPVVLGYLRAQGTEESEDLTGEVFLQVVRDLPRFEGDQREFRAWVLTIAHHRLVDSYRYHRRRPLEPASHAVIEAAAQTGNVEDEAVGQIRRGEIRAALESLTPEQRDVLLLRVFGDLTVDEVGRALGKRSGAVKALQRRGLAALKRTISRWSVTL
jgi:RNA polymerase sigma factor (sigma-70 family)